MDEISDAIIDCGTEAVLSLRGLYPNETMIREPEISQSIYGILKVRFPTWDIRRDPYYYTDALKSLGHDCSSLSIVEKFGQISADIGVLRDGNHPTLVEIKIVDEGRKQAGIFCDRKKLLRLAEIARVNGYVGALVCQDRGKDIRQSLDELERDLHASVAKGPIHKSKDGNEWEWTFVCAKVTE